MTPRSISDARVLTVMGSGETSPTMVKVHRRVLEQLGDPPVPAVLLETPYGFQENASELSAKAVAYFAESLRAPIEVAGYRSEGEIGSAAHDASLKKIREARFVFAGPGSPTYALRQWRASVIPGLLADKLGSGGAVTFASAAAVTLGALAAPIYEIYKVGEEPRWLEGIDLVSPALGLTAAVIPHFNNTEGGTHDTRFCYLGERRLSIMEEMLPPGGVIIGVDEHTALVLNLSAGTASVVGNGVVTVRVHGRSAVLGPCVDEPLSAIEALATDLRSAPAGSGAPAGSEETEGSSNMIAGSGASISACNVPESPFLAEVAGSEAAFHKALGSSDVGAAVEALLDLDRVIANWATETFSGDERARAHVTLRSMVLDLGELARKGAADPRKTVGPLVDALLVARDEARSTKRFADADRLRELLTHAGVEVRDSPQGTEWYLREDMFTG